MVLQQTTDVLPVLKKSIFNYQKGDSLIHLFPTIHDEIMFSAICGSILDKLKPDKIAVELPVQLEDKFRFAIKRFPTFTLLHQGSLQATEFIDNSVPSYVIQPSESIYWLSFLGIERNIPVVFVDDWHGITHSWGIGLNYYELAAIGWEKFWEISGSIIQKHSSNNIHNFRSQKIATRIMNNVGSLLVNIGAAHWPIIHQILIENGYKPLHDVFSSTILSIKPVTLQLDEIGDWNVSDIHPHTLHLATQNLPFHIAKMISDDLEGKQFKILDSIRTVFFEAEKIYRHKFDDTISLGSYLRLFQYLRNLCRIQRKLLPGLFDYITVAKGMGDDDYAYEVFRIAVTYPFEPKEPLDNQVKFTPDENQSEVIRFAFKRRYKRPILKEVDNIDDFDPIPEEDYAGQWAEIWNKYSDGGFGYVSHVPEDIFLEKYLRFLEKRLKEILMEEQSSSEEFKTSLEDGIDWRETISNFHDKKIYVKKLPKNVPPIGSIIVQFIEEPVADEFRYYSTLYAEHNQESHLSMLTTEVGKEFVGPGICRIKIAALISQYPPLGYPVRIPRGSDDLKFRLVYAAMNMSLSNIIGFVSPRPPSPAVKYFASQHGFRIIYLPMIQLSKASMNRLRTMHLLANRNFRDDASEYIGY